jgi:hypothetical protein
MEFLRARPGLSSALAAAAVAAWTWLPSSQTTPAPIKAVGLQIDYEGYGDVRTPGNDSTWGQALTHRYVNGELRFLTIVHGARLHEFLVAGAKLGGVVTEASATWDLGPTDALNNFNGISFE